MTDKERREIVYDKTPIDKILSITVFKDCFEVIGTAGGDTLTYRFYNDGAVTER